MPPRPVLCLLLVLATVPPFVSQAAGSVTGAFTMFNRIVRYHVDLRVVGSRGERSITVRELVPHLSREARAVLYFADGYTVGADQVDVIAAGLPDLARLLCELFPDAREARARLMQDQFDVTRRTERSVTLACPAR